MESLISLLILNRAACLFLMYVNVYGGVMREVTSCMSGEGGKGPGTDARSGLSAS